MKKRDEGKKSKKSEKMKHPDEKQDKALVRKMVKKPCMKG